MIVIDRPAFTSPRICTASTNVPRSTTAVGTAGALPAPPSEPDSRRWRTTAPADVLSSATGHFITT